MSGRYSRLWILVALIAVAILCVCVYREEIILAYAQLGTAKTLAGLRAARNIDLRTVDEKGIVLRPSRKEFVAGEPYLFRFKWCVPPPSGEELRYSESAPHEKADGGRPTYYVYSLNVIAGRRFFVFLGKLKPDEYPYYGWFKDEDVSWYFQTLLSNLNAAERQEEQNYRRECNNRFPVEVFK